MRDQHLNVQESSAQVSKLRQGSLSHDQDFISRTEFQELLIRFAQMEQVLSDYHSFKEEVGVIMNGVDARLKASFGTLQGQVNDISTHTKFSLGLWRGHLKGHSGSKNPAPPILTRGCIHGDC